MGRYEEIILKALNEGGPCLRLTDIAEYVAKQLNKDKQAVINTVSKELVRLAERGKVKKQGWGTYCLPQASEEREEGVAVTPSTKVAVRPLEVPIPTLYVPSDTYYSLISDPKGRMALRRLANMLYAKALELYPDEEICCLEIEEYGSKFRAYAITKDLFYLPLGELDIQGSIGSGRSHRDSVATKQATG